MPKTRRRADRDQFWRDTLTAWKESGQTVTAFCATRGLGESTFFANRREHARHEQSPNSPPQPSPNPPFAAVRAIPDATVEMVVPGGVVVRVPVGADATAVSTPAAGGSRTRRACVETKGARAPPEAGGRAAATGGD